VTRKWHESRRNRNNHILHVGVSLCYTLIPNCLIMVSNFHSQCIHVFPLLALHQRRLWYLQHFKQVCMKTCCLQILHGCQFFAINQRCNRLGCREKSGEFRRKFRFSHADGRFFSFLFPLQQVVKFLQVYLGLKSGSFQDRILLLIENFCCICVLLCHPLQHLGNIHGPSTSALPSVQYVGLQIYG
jgi:hypothetical protein